MIANPSFNSDFRPSKNSLFSRVAFSERSPFPRKVAKRGCVREGLEFEAKAQIHLDKQSLGEAFHSKWIEFTFTGDSLLKHAQPDSFYLAGNRIYLFEMKLRHTPRSAAQLMKYKELLHELYPTYSITLIETYKYWDWIVYPQASKQITISEINTLKDGEIGLLHLGDLK